MAKKDGNWFARHKILSVIIAVVIIGGIAGAASGGKSNTDTVPNSNSDKTSTDSKTTDTKKSESAKEKLTIKNSVASDKGYGMIQVDGEVTNNDSSEHSATLKATFYDADGKILGTASGAVNDLAPGETKTFSLMSTDKIDGYKDMKVQVDTLL